MTYIYNDEKCYAKDEYSKLQDNKSALRDIINDTLIHTNDTTPFFKILHKPKIDEWIIPYIDAAQKIKENFDDIVVIGMGGATLNPKAIINLVQEKASSPKIHFISTTDPFYFDNLFAQLNLKKTIFVIISKSGDTLETIALAKESIARYKKIATENYKNNFLFIIGRGDSKLRILATESHAKIYNHADEISGRYSAFTNITTLLALIANIDVEELFRGSSAVIKNFWQEKEESVTARAALTSVTRSLPIHVNIGYLNCFAPFLEWYSQIIAESLGKNGIGITPIRGLGPNDQHSMLQLYLDGPKDKLFTMFYADLKEMMVCNDLSQTNDVCFKATINALCERNLPVRTILLQNLSAYSVGELMTHCMIEVVLSGLLLRINPFDQPGVELIKYYAKSILQDNNNS